MCCDIRVASEDAQFGAPEVGLGIIPAAGGSQTIPRVIGRAPALDMLLTSRWVKADEALRLKLVNRVVARDDLLPTVEKLAHKIMSYNPMVINCVKQAVTRGLDLSLAQGLELENNLGTRLLNLRN